MRARTYLEIHYLELKSARDSVRGFRVCSFCRKKERACHFAGVVVSAGPAGFGHYVAGSVGKPSAVFSCWNGGSLFSNVSLNICGVVLVDTSSRSVHEHGSSVWPIWGPNGQTWGCTTRAGTQRAGTPSPRPFCELYCRRHLTNIT